MAHRSPSEAKHSQGALMPSPSTQEGLKRQAMQARSYLERHELLNWMQDVLQNLLKDQPDDPWTFIEASVQKRKATKLPKLQHGAVLPVVSPRSREKAETLLPLIGNLKKLESDQQERRAELAALLAKQPPRPSEAEEAERRAAIQANLDRLEELKSDTAVLEATRAKLQRAQPADPPTCHTEALQTDSTSPNAERRPAALKSEPQEAVAAAKAETGFDFASFYAAHAGTSETSASLPRLYAQFLTLRCAASAPKSPQKEAVPRPLAPAPFGAPGSFGDYYAAHVATALMPSELPRLYEQFRGKWAAGSKVRKSRRPDKVSSPRAPAPFGGPGAFGDYYAAHVATALIPENLPRLYEQFRTPKPSAGDGLKVPQKEKVPSAAPSSSRSTAVSSARSKDSQSSRGRGSRQEQPAMKKLPLAGLRPSSESTARSSSVPEVASRRSRPDSAARQQMDSRQRKTREALQQLTQAASVPISKSTPELGRGDGKGPKAPPTVSQPQAKKPPQPPSQPPAPREATRAVIPRPRSDRSQDPPPQRRAEPARLEPLPARRQRQGYAGPSLRDEMRVRDELGKLFSTSK
ncbi:unnamed protein product [Symbiodinium sp. CCMP2592]|nr:unnamed protein product [Symbiodinium sp. CCMP2592]